MTALLVLAAAAGVKALVGGDDHRVHRAALGGGAELDHLHHGRRLLHLAHKGDGFIIRGCLLPLGLLAGGQQVGRHIFAAGRERSGGFAAGGSYMEWGCKAACCAIATVPARKKRTGDAYVRMPTMMILRKCFVETSWGETICSIRSYGVCRHSHQFSPV